MTEPDSVFRSLPTPPGSSSPGRFEQILRSGLFAVTAELSPPDSADPEEVFSRARVFEGYVDAINATDGSGANCHMSSVGVCSLLTRLGYSMVMQISCRDRNRIAIQGEVLGAAAMGVANILCLTGDGVQAGDHPAAKPVFDLDAVSLISLVRGMRDESRFESGRAISSPPRVLIGGAANPFVPPFDFRVGPSREEERGRNAVRADSVLLRRAATAHLHVAGARSRAPRALPHSRGRGAAGVGPGGTVDSRPRSGGAHSRGDHRPARARALAPDGGPASVRETIQEIREIDGVAGVHVMAYRQEEAIAEIIDASEVLGERRPWRPGDESRWERRAVQ